MRVGLLLLRIRLLLGVGLLLLRIRLLPRWVALLLLIRRVLAGLRGRRNFEDSLGICIFTTRTRLENVCRALEAATGWRFTVDDAVRFGRRTAAINRAVALRCGHTPAMEHPSARYGSTPHDGPAKGQAVADQWDKMVDIWYRDVGYDRKTGKPLPETLAALGLDWLARDLWGAAGGRRRAGYGS